MKSGGRVIPFLFLFPFLPNSAHAIDLCQEMRASWEKVTSYTAIFQTKSFNDGKLEKKEIYYSFKKPNKVRMDMIEPHRGTVLIYNPDVSKKVQIKFSWWLPKLSYSLDHKRVTSDRGSTIDNSHLGAWIKGLCHDMVIEEVKVTKKNGYFLIQRSKMDEYKRVTLSEEKLPVGLEVLGKAEEIVESSWLKDLRVNPNLSQETFVSFEKRSD